MKQSTLVVIVIAALLAVPAVKKYRKWSEHEFLAHSVRQWRLPHVLGPGQIETRAEVGDKVLRTWYTLDLNFSTDEDTRKAFLAMVKRVACTDSTPVEFLKRGYSLDRTYTVSTPHGPEDFHMVIAPADCPTL
jgi:hypothetical protein